jgi:hypothetical protein
MMMMKGFSMIIGGFVLLYGMTACSDGNSSVFGSEADQRVDKAVILYRSTLADAGNGWAMDFYPSDTSKGGVVYTARFDTAGRVSMATEMAVSTSSSSAAVTPGTEVTSLYRVLAEQGVILSFDTYNSLFHYWSEPFGSWDTDGYASDDEFLLHRVSAAGDTIFSTGKKYGNEMDMYKLDCTPADYIHQVTAQGKQLATPRYRMTVQGHDYRISINTVTRQFSYMPSADSSRVMPFIPTARGFRLYKPVTLEDVSFRNFVYETEADRWTAANGLVIIPQATAIESFCATLSKWHFIFDLSAGSSEMDDTLFALLRQANAALLTESNSHYIDMYLGKTRIGQPTSLIWKYYDGERPHEYSYLVDLSILSSSDNSISILPQQEGTFFLSSLQPIVDYICSAAPYSIEFDSTTQPTRAKLVSKTKNGVWFNLKQ